MSTDFVLPVALGRRTRGGKYYQLCRRSMALQ